ncbi:unnamed protein product [Protopolystoma xenopodis]|uniref:Mitochondrial import receptor subunit TOM20 homolog n=1 Tax=Protopolystoma xenopodis TaxID=117903 RepID=A0A448WFG9_9PLAT|nr:unnamed protein product [Protopolystoma xenopodis]
MLKEAGVIAAFGAGFCLVAYCIYFDHKRRSHPDFRAKLIKKRRQQALAAKKTIDLPCLSDQNAVQRFFLEQVQSGEVALNMGAIEEGVQHFALAAAVCGQPGHLLQLLRTTLPPPVFSLLAKALPDARAQVAAAYTQKDIEEELE